jgi:hypothetical protein
MPAFTEFLNHLFVERGDIIWLTAGDQSVVHHDFLVDSFPPAFLTSVLIAGHDVNV